MSTLRHAPALLIWSSRGTDIGTQDPEDGPTNVTQNATQEHFTQFYRLKPQLKQPRWHQGLFSLLSSITCEDYNAMSMCSVHAVHFQTLHLSKMRFWYTQRGESLPARIPEHLILTHARWCHIPTLGKIQKTSSQTTARCLPHRSLKYMKKFLNLWHKLLLSCLKFFFFFIIQHKVHHLFQ